MKTYSGIALIALAFGMLLINLSDAVADLKNWHDQTGQFTLLTPAFVAVFLKQIGTLITGVIGGNLLPSPGK